MAYLDSIVNKLNVLYYILRQDITVITSKNIYFDYNFDNLKITIISNNILIIINEI